MNIDVNLLKSKDFKSLVLKRISTFYGYGSLKAPVWFVGMEEGLGQTESTAEFISRFRTTEGKVMVDIRKDVNEQPSHAQWFTPHPSIQPTWKYPIALFLYLKNGVRPDIESRRAYQEKRLGDVKVLETALLELMPLPASSLKKQAWIYAELGVSELETRKAYLARYKPVRTAKLRSLLQKYRPKLVVFYSLTYRSDWEEAIGKKVAEITKDMYFAQDEHTSYCIIPQGAMPGISYARLYEFADAISSSGHKKIL